MTMRFLLIVVFMAAGPGCSLLFSAETQEGAQDAAPGAGDAVDAIGFDATGFDATGCEGMGCSGLVLDLSGPGLYTLNTITGVLEGPGDPSLLDALPNSSAFEISLAEFLLGDAEDDNGLSILRVVGNKPLIIKVSGSLTIKSDGGIDVSSSVLGMPAGAGATSNAMCELPISAAQTYNAGGGGSGGSFQTLGGDGGNGGEEQAVGSFAALQVPQMDVLDAGPTGGCPGSRGGAASAAGSISGAAGAGGGGVKLESDTAIYIDGFVNAGGGGGGGGGNNSSSTSGSGGGGGGSGGMIWLEAPAVTIGQSGALFAKGGGGGGGANQCAYGVGGQDALLASASNPALGGVGGSAGNVACSAEGGDGGNGTTATTGGTGKQGENGATGGGGGGGGGGYIIVKGGFSSTANPVNISPSIIVVAP